MAQKTVKFCLLNDTVCIRLMLHGSDVQHLFAQNDWVETTDLAAADAILVNTCAFLKKAEVQALARIEEIVRNKRPGQQVVVFGCLPSICPFQLSELDVIAVPGRDLETVIRLFDLKRTERRVGHRVVREGRWSQRALRRLNRLFLHDSYFTYLYDKERVYHLKIAEGCQGQCTYCAERLARGTLVSQPVADVVAEFRRGLDEGNYVFSLNADDVGMYGQDRDESIADLLEAMMAEPRDFRLVLTEFNPAALVRYEERLLPLLASPKIVFITVPIESGNDRILKKMRRPYAIGPVMAVLRRLHAANPRLKINTHLIVGFPGETEAEYADTLRLLVDFPFNKVKAFAYSLRPNTVAAMLPGRLSEQVKQERKARLESRAYVTALKRGDFKAIILNKLGSHVT